MEEEEEEQASAAGVRRGEAAGCHLWSGAVKKLFLPQHKTFGSHSSLRWRRRRRRRWSRKSRRRRKRKRTEARLSLTGLSAEVQPVSPGLGERLRKGQRRMLESAGAHSPSLLSCHSGHTSPCAPRTPLGLKARHVPSSQWVQNILTNQRAEPFILSKCYCLDLIMFFLFFKF